MINTATAALILVPVGERAHALTRYRLWLLCRGFDVIADHIVESLSPALLQMARAATYVADTMTNTMTGARLGRPRRALERSSRGPTTPSTQTAKGSQP